MPFDVALSELTEKQGAFVEAYVANGGCGSAAAREAGYSELSARQIAANLVTLPHIQAAITQRQKREYTSLLSLSINRLRERLNDPKSKASFVLDATIKLGDRVGLGPKPDADGKDNSKPISDMSLNELYRLIERIEAGTKVIDLTPGTGGVAPSSSQVIDNTDKVTA